MRVYVTTKTLAWEYTEVKEVFVNELDAKKWVGDEEAKLTTEERESFSFDYKPRELRTAWNG